MNAKDLKEKYIAFFESKNHKKISSSSLIPENDPTVLFNTAGMQPLVPYLQGQTHPLGKRLTNVQKCIRTGDIDEVGDDTHLTFFEMLGNWSLGDYFKEDAIKWSFEFLTSKEWLNIPIDRLAVTCFAGDSDAPKDDEAANIWKSLGVSEKRIAFLGKKDNWWGPAGTQGPCGPDSEMFYWKPNDTSAPEEFDPEDENWVEIWNDVFMQYDKQVDGSFKALAQQNVDTGMGTERVIMTLQGKDSVYETDVFVPILDKIAEISKKEYRSNEQSFRIIADHLKAATMIIGDERGVAPSNVDQGYIVRRLIRRAIRHARKLGVTNSFCSSIAEVVIDMYKDSYDSLVTKKDFVLTELTKEEEKFQRTIEKGEKEFERISIVMKEHGQTEISGKSAFLLFQSYGYPLEMTVEMAKEVGMSVDEKGFNKAFEKHQELSRKGAEQKFKGGLANDDDMTVKLHTATHLLNEALRKVISPDITQKGSNINSERLRFDFNFDRALTDEEKQAVEDEVNKQIKEAHDITITEMTPDEAKAKGAQAEFGTRYPEKVTVYDIGQYSKEICMGPHVKNTSELGIFKIKKEQSSAAGVRRIKAVLINE